MRDKDTQLLMAAISAMQDQLKAHEARINELENRPRRQRSRRKEEPINTMEAEMMAKLEQEREARRATHEAEEREIQKFARALKNPDKPEHKQLMQDLNEMAQFDKTPRFNFELPASGASKLVGALAE